MLQLIISHWRYTAMTAWSRVVIGIISILQNLKTFMTYDVKILNTDNGIHKQQVQLDNGNAILQYCQCTYMDVSDKVLWIRKRIGRKRTCKGIVTISAIRKFNFGKLVLYIFHLHCQPFVRDIIIIFILSVPVNTVFL